MRSFNLSIAILLASAPVASAIDPYDAESVVRHIFEVADTDGSGSLNRAEYEAADLERYGVSFDECDADADGETTLAEYLSLYDRYHPPADSDEV